MHTPAPAQLLFLPGALGDTSLWQPADQRITHPARRIHLGWPGFGSTPARADVQGLDDLVRLTLSHIDRPTALIAQSMGGVIALRAALSAPPGLLTHLVLSVTSGGLGMGALRELGAQDWRPALRQAHPTLADWFTGHDEDLGPLLPSIDVPTLLLWGDADPISPVTVGHHLEKIIPGASLHVIAGGQHDMARTHADQVAPLIQAHLLTGSSASLHALDAFLTEQCGLVAEAAHGGTWRNYFHKTVVRDPARSTRVLKVIADNHGRPRQIQLCASSDNNNAMLVPVPHDLRALLPLIHTEIQQLQNKRPRP